MKSSGRVCLNAGRRSDQTEEPRPGRHAVRAFAVRFDVVAGRCLAKAVRQPFLEVFETWQVLDIERPSWQLGDVLSLAALSKSLVSRCRNSVSASFGGQGSHGCMPCVRARGSTSSGSSVIPRLSLCPRGSSPPHDRPRSPPPTGRHACAGRRIRRSRLAIGSVDRRRLAGGGLIAGIRGRDAVLCLLWDPSHPREPRWHHEKFRANSFAQMLDLGVITWHASCSRSRTGPSDARGFPFVIFVPDAAPQPRGGPAARAR